MEGKFRTEKRPAWRRRTGGSLLNTRGFKLFLCLWLILTVLCGITAGMNSYSAYATSGQPEITSPGALLMEPETGAVLYEKDKDTRRSPASVTKIMTLLLIFEHLEQGSLKLEEEVVATAHAKSMGGSQVYLEEGEIQTVETLIKCIVVASGNDASVAMAEHISGSEEAFVSEMNKKASELGMKNTHFVDCCGLTDSDDHYTTPYDIALMSRELILKHPDVLDYSSIWMENITHTTAKGSSEFGLTNTNRMLRTYEGCVGLKTGSTSKAKFCISAVAKRNGITLISVIMGAPDYKVRIKDASALLDYGFSRCTLYTDENPPELSGLKVTGGIKESVKLVYDGTFRYLSTTGGDFKNVTSELELPDSAAAPVEKGEKAGELIYYSKEEKLGSLSVLYAESVKRAGYMDCLKKTLRLFWL